MNLWDNSIGYTILRYYVDAVIRSSYNHIHIEGCENIPEDGAILFAANHTNTLMDALVILQDHKGPISFGARADIFRNPKAARILHWLKILPLARQRDGANAVAGNSETFNRIVECIGHSTPFCLYPEGTHRTMHSLQPLKKGIFRIAVQAVHQLRKPVYIVPVGIDYEDFFHSRTELSMKYGKPLCVNEVLQQHPDEAEAIRHMMDTLYERMSSLIRFVPDDNNYETNWIKYLKSHKQKSTSLIVKVLFAILGLPFFIISSLLAWPIVIPAELIVRKLKDKAWSNTVRFGCKLLILPLLVIAVGIPAFIHLPWYWAIVWTLGACFSASIFYDYLNLFRSILKR